MTGQLTFEVMDLLCSRLCHDLISPVGAINNGVELIEDLGEDMVGEAMGLIAQSGRRAAGRLRCYRLCYGAAGAQSTVGLDEARDIAAGYLEGGKATLVWNVTADWGIDGPPIGTIKVLLNLLVVADEALSQGGIISVRVDDGEAGRVIVIRAEGTNAGLREHQDAALDGTVGTEELSARTVQAYVTGLFARRFGMTINHSTVEGGPLKLQLNLP
jgi:histidine phosphotransferase ChpT